MNCIEIKSASVNRVRGSDLTEIDYLLTVNQRHYSVSFKISGFAELDPAEYSVRADPLVTMLFVHAMRFGYNIKVDLPLSKKLYYQLVKHVIPQIHVCNKKETEPIVIDAPVLTDEVNSGSYVGTGVSCGIDSLTTIYEYTDLNTLPGYGLTHLLYFKQGAHDGQIGRVDTEIEDNLFHAQLKKVREFCSLCGLPLIVVESNINAVLAELFGFTNYVQTHTVRNAGIVMLLQQYFNKYYYADAYNLDDFSLRVQGGIAHYEKWLLPLLSTENISFYSANEAMTRIEKTKLLSNYPLSYSNTLVCWMEGKNCGKCDKCILTLVTMDLLGCLDRYAQSFDLEAYKTNRKKYMARIVAAKRWDPAFKVVYRYMRDNGIALPPFPLIVQQFVLYVMERLKKHSLKDVITYLTKR